MKLGSGSFRELAPLIGREREFERLSSILASLGEGTGRVLTLVGETGIGKSRLLAELSLLAEQQGKAVWLQGEGDGAAREAYGPWISIVRQVCGSVEDDDAGDVASKVSRCLAELDLAAEAAPFLLGLLSGPAGEGASERVVHFDARNSNRRLMQFFADLVFKIAQRQPLVLAIEDAHRADAGSITVIERLLPLLEGQPILIVLTFEPRGSSALVRLRQLLRETWFERWTEIALEPLSAELSQRLAGDLLPEGSSLHGVEGEVARQAEGNPLFVTEAIRALLSRVGAFPTGAAGSAEELRARLPETLQDVIGVRIGGLRAGARRACDLAAVLGPRFRAAVLELLWAGEPEGGEPESLEVALAELVRGGVLQRTSAESATYRFRHLVVQEALHEGIPEGARRELHARIAAALEANLSGGAQAAEIAHHYRETGDRSRAVSYLMRAGAEAMRACSPRQALEHYARAMEIVNEPAGGLDPELIPHLLVRRSYLYLQIGALEEAAEEARLILRLPQTAYRAEALWLLASAAHQLDLAYGFRCVQEAIELARAGGDDRILARCLAFSGFLGLWCGELPSRPGARALLAEASAIAESAADATFWLETFEAFKDIATPAEERHAFNRALDMALEGGDEGTAFTVLAYLADLDSRVGRHQQAIEYSQQALSLNVENQPMWAFCLRSMGWSMVHCGRREEGLYVLEQALAIFQETGWRSRIAGTYLRLCVLDRDGDLGEAGAERARAWLAAAQEIGEPAELAYAQAHTAWLAARSGDAEGRDRHAAEARRMSLSAAPWWYEAGIEESLGEIALMSGNPAAAVTGAERLLEIAASELVPEVEVRGLWLRGRALRASGNREAAQEVLAAALTLSRALDLPYLAGRIGAGLH